MVEAGGRGTWQPRRRTFRHRSQLAAMAEKPDVRDGPRNWITTGDKSRSREGFEENTVRLFGT